MMELSWKIITQTDYRSDGTIWRTRDRAHPVEAHLKKERQRVKRVRIRLLALLKRAAALIQPVLDPNNRCCRLARWCSKIDAYKQRGEK